MEGTPYFLDWVLELIWERGSTKCIMGWGRGGGGVYAIHDKYW